MGNSGTGNLPINGPNASLLIHSIIAGNSAGGYGTVTVSSGSALSIGLVVGAQGTGNMVMNGGFVTSGSAVVGANEGSSGTVTVSSGTWSGIADSAVGSSGKGRLQIDGGEVNAPIIRIGVMGTGEGQITLNGGVLRTGQVVKGSGTASLQLGGGTLRATGNSTDFLSGFGSADVVSTGAGIIDSNGFAITSTVGVSGTGALTKVGNGTLRLTGTNTYTGGTVVRAGTLAVDGGVINHASRNFLVGNAFGEDAAVSVLNGGRITSLNTNLGNVAGSTGSATVTSGTWTNNTFYVGLNGNGNLLVNGGLVSNSTSYLGFNPGTSGTATVSSGTWFNSGALVVGDLGTGSLAINGGQVSSANGYLGLSGGSGEASVTSGRWTNTDTLSIGQQGQGVLSISGSGVVTSGTVVLASMAGSQGTLNIGSGGVAGALQAGLITGGAGTAQVNFNHLGSLAFGVQMDGSLAVTKSGAGMLILTGNNGYTGGTEVLAGTLLLTDVGAGSSVLGAGPVTVGESAALGGIGTVLGDTVLAGTLAPGNSPGEMHFAGALLMENTATVRMELADLGTFDQISVDGEMTYNGALRISFLDDYRPEVGDAFALFDAPIIASGSDFATIVFDEAGYSGTFNTASGLLTITAVPESSTAALLVVGSFLAMKRRRRQRSAR